MLFCQVDRFCTDAGLTANSQGIFQSFAACCGALWSDYQPPVWTCGSEMKWSSAVEANSD